ncbi:MAG: hypothetical protein GF364_10570 [Candidatus Lokiarchaeota archaeon]|nr:hypothetical protein [Candidatus Lokiarchaeota archaeon]
MKFWFHNQKKSEEMRFLLARNRYIAFGITAIIVSAGFMGILVYTFTTPMVSTSYYHANVQFRAGTEESYYAIYRQSLEHILKMYDDHPNWIWTLECQGLLIDMAYKDYPDIFEMIQQQNQRGQLELICPQYSHGLAVAYNYKDFAGSVEYNKYLMEDVYNLTISNVIVLQEGQFLPAFPLVKHLGFDTIAVSRDQMSYYNYFADSPLLSYGYGGIDGCYVIPLNWLPCIEAGVLHHQLALSDSERINTGDIEGPYEFNFNPDKMHQIELRHIELERRGNIWKNMSDWVDFCVEKGKIKPMNKFLPENHWTPNRHQSTSRWMAWGNSESDDGLVHARNYYTRNLIQTAEIVNENAYSLNLIDTPTYENNKERILNASIHLWKAQVTDTSGVNPNRNEFIYAINNTRDAQDYANLVIDDIRSKIAGWQMPIQVDCYDKIVINQTVDLTNYTVIDSSLQVTDLKEKYGFDLNIDYSAESLCPHNSSYTNVTLATYIGGIKYEFDLESISLEFLSRRGKYINNTQDSIGVVNNNAACNGQTTEQHIIFMDNWEKVYYSPSLAENTTQLLTRSDYTHPMVEGNEDYIVPLPISNGFLYNEDNNYAIITNNTMRHISVKWEQNYVDFYETELEYNSRYEFICFKGNLEEAHLLANIINPYPTWEMEAY